MPVPFSHSPKNHTAAGTSFLLPCFLFLDLCLSIYCIWRPIFSGICRVTYLQKSVNNIFQKKNSKSHELFPYFYTLSFLAIFSSQKIPSLLFLHYFGIYLDPYHFSSSLWFLKVMLGLHFLFGEFFKLVIL